MKESGKCEKEERASNMKTKIQDREKQKRVRSETNEQELERQEKRDKQKKYREKESLVGKNEKRETGCERRE